VTGCEVGVDLTVETLRARTTRWCSRSARCVAATTPRPGPRAGRRAPGDGAPGAGQQGVEGDGPPSIDAHGKHVVIIGGGDTGADCLRHGDPPGRASVTQLDQYPTPPSTSDDERSPWPTWPWILRTYPAHEEAGERKFAVAVKRFVGSERRERDRGRAAEVRVEKDPSTGRREVIPVNDDGRDAAGRPGAAGDRLRGRRGHAAARRPGPLADPRGTLSCGADWQTEPPGCSSAATPTAAHRWWCGRSRRAARWPTRSTRS
jgi:glutamate synthase (NADPH/NADH) small chain